MIDKELEKISEEFHKMESARGEFWFMAQKLMKEGYDIEAYILILATWNFAAWRNGMRTFDLKKFKETIKNLEPTLKKFKNKKFENANLEDPELVEDIKLVYNELKEIVMQTGAAKVMAIENPKFFVMWDTKIRKMYGIKNSASANDYVRFLKKIQNEFGDIKWKDKRVPLAKAIDEYNFVQTQKELL